MKRLALICPACIKAGDVPHRAFNAPNWRCPVHQNVKPIVQANKPYFGRPT